MPYIVILEHGPTSVGAYVPDLPGCVAVGATEAQAQPLITEAIVLHRTGMGEDGVPVPPSEEPTGIFAPGDTRASGHAQDWRWLWQRLRREGTS
jgi:predicted RNase H-like HicB family nuclease